MCRAVATARERCNVSDVTTQRITVRPLGYAGHSRQELLDVAEVAVQGFFVACYDASARTFTPDDADLERLRCQVYEDLAGRYGPHESGRSFLLVARDTAQAVVGCIGVEAMPSGSIPVSPGTLDSHEWKRHRPVAYMSNLAVLSSMRCGGIGRRLILDAEERVQSQLCLSEVVLMVNAANTPARTLYETLGYNVIFEDPWAVRAVCVCGGEVERVRVLNVGYAHKLPRGGS